MGRVLQGIGWICLLVLASSIQGMGAKPSWKALEFFIGDWQGASEGEPGRGTVERRYRLTLNASFMEVRNKSTYPPQEKNKKGEVHEDFGIFSYDAQRNKFILRQFNVEGFVNQYVEESISADGKRLIFVSEAIENIPAGWRARETYTILNEREFVERFELAEPGKDFQLYSEIRLRRKVKK